MRGLFRAWIAHWQVRCCLLLGRQRAALVLVERALAQHPDDGRAMATRAHLLAELGDKPSARDALVQLVRLQPRNAAAWFNYGFLCEEMGHAEEAERAFRQALDMDPLLDRAWYGLGLSLIAQRRLDDAVSALKQNTALQPMNPYGWYQLARVHVDRHEPEQAEVIIHHLRRFEPRLAAQLQRETGLGGESPREG